MHIQSLSLYIHIYKYISLSLSLYIYVYTYTYIRCIQYEHRISLSLSISLSLYLHSFMRIIRRGAARHKHMSSHQFEGSRDAVPMRKLTLRSVPARGRTLTCGPMPSVDHYVVLLYCCIVDC